MLLINFKKMHQTLYFGALNLNDSLREKRRLLSMINEDKKEKNYVIASAARQSRIIRL